MDDLGDRMKYLEGFESSRKFLPGLPVYARIDGRGFSKFTKGMNRPYDLRMIAAMVSTTKTLVEKTQATIGYTQSDEISLVWENCDHWFDRRVMKMTSVLSGLATAAFTSAILKSGDPDFIKYADRLPHFDTRAMVMPSKVEAVNALVWRNLDATKNAISMAASHYLPHKELQGVTGKQKQELLFQKHGINFNDYPSQFKRGTWVRRETIEKVLTDDELCKIPPKNRPESNIVLRTVLMDFDLPKLSSIPNRVKVIFENETPELEDAQNKGTEL
jgi:tRNA(His) guanylyltransferase